MYKRCLMMGAVAVMGVAALLTACGVPKPRPAVPGAAPSVRALPQAPASPDLYVIDPSQSDIRILVYRAGVLASAGHNHVITNRAVSGWVKFAGKPSEASFAFTVPVANFEVDNAGDRALEGSDFFEEVDDDAKAGTRHNMLSPALLDGIPYPQIVVTSVAVTQIAGVVTATLAVNVAGHESTLVVPFEVATSAAQVSASGIVKVRQTSLGLRPFSIFHGALQVQDDITVKFVLVALKSPAA